MWGRPEAERSISTKPPLIKETSKTGRKSVVDQRTRTSRTNPMSFDLDSSRQSNSFDPRVQLSTIRANSVSCIRSESSDAQGYRRYAPYDNRTASNQESSIDLRTNPMSYATLNTGRIANTSSPFMIVPPPTTLQSAFSESIRRSMLDSDMPVERINEQRNEVRFIVNIIVNRKCNFLKL